jgi:glycosyltransferase involved in cell wall biosynthesis
MGNRDITVAICTHDNADVLDRALRRLARQRITGASWELLVVDNRSSDRTPELLRAWQESGAFPLMRVVREERLGLSHARRTAVNEARSDLIAFIDDDCFLERGWIAAALAFARREPRAGAFGGRVRIRWETPPTDIGRRCEWLLARQELGDVPVKLPPVAGVPLVGAGIVIRRAALLESGWIERCHFMGRTGKALTSGDDAEISFRIRSAGWDLWYTPTMKLDHVLAAWRSDPSYLTRLHHAVGLTLPHIWNLAGVYQRTPLATAGHVLRGLRRAVKYALSSLRYRIVGNLVMAQLRWMQANMNLGVARGALALPAPEPEPRAEPSPPPAPSHAGGGPGLLPQPTLLIREP